MIIRLTAINHGQIYNLRTHGDKLSRLAGTFPSLRSFLEDMHENCPPEPFFSGPRSSSIHAGPLPIYDQPKTHTRCEHTMQGLQVNANRFRERHEQVQVYMLENDDCTVAMEVPLWINYQEAGVFQELMTPDQFLSGHVDVLSIEDGLIWIWDYKPNAHKERWTHIQLSAYALMLSHRTGISLKQIRCGYFDGQSCFTFTPRQAHIDCFDFYSFVPADQTRQTLLQQKPTKQLMPIYTPESTTKPAERLPDNGVATSLNDTSKNVDDYSTGDPKKLSKPTSHKSNTSHNLAHGECPHCGTADQPHGKYCVECGLKFQVQCLNCEIAIKIWHKVCGECGVNQQALLRATTLLALGDSHFEAGHLEAAISSYSTAIELDPNNAEFYRRRAQANYEFGEITYSVLDWSQFIYLMEQDDKPDDVKLRDAKRAKAHLLDQKLLTEDQVVFILSQSGDFAFDLDYFNKYTAIENNAAERLIAHQGDLFLEGLTKLSDAAAKSLSKHHGPLYLTGLTEVSDMAVKYLSVHALKWFGNEFRWPLTKLSAAAAEILSKHGGELDLNGITELSAAAAANLSKHEADLWLGGLTKLSDAAAESLSQHTGDLLLEGLTDLSDASAKSLSKHRGRLCLSGLTKLSAAAAESLSKHAGDLDLPGLTELSDAAAANLSKHEADLWLGGLTKLSDAAAESLSQHTGDLFLEGLTALSDPSAKSLSKHHGHLGLEGLTELSDAAAESLSKYRGRLCLKGLTKLSDAAAKSLSKHRGYINLKGLTELSDAATEILCKHRGEIAIGRHPAECFTDFGSTRLSLWAAGSLIMHQRELEPRWRTQLSAEAAESLSENHGTLDLNGITELSDAAAERLSKHRGHLHLSGLTELSDVAAESLSNHDGELHLSELTKMSDAAAESLSKQEEAYYRQDVVAYEEARLVEDETQLTRERELITEGYTTEQIQHLLGPGATRQTLEQWVAKKEFYDLLWRDIDEP
jgi:hypothetical protein